MTNLFRTILLLTLIYNSSASAQDKGQLVYKKLINDKATLAPRTENYIVYFEKDRSLELGIPLAPREMPQSNEGQGYSVGVIKAGKPYFLLKDFKAKSLTWGPNISFKHLLVEDTLSNFVWKITNEKKQILNYNCKKATTSFRGRDFEAWYTEDVPLKNGPWKFCGLPGLIVRVLDTKNIYTFDLVSVKFEKANDLILGIPEEYIKDKAISHGDYIALYIEQLKKLEVESNAFSYDDLDHSVTTTISIPPLIEKL